MTQQKRKTYRMPSIGEIFNALDMLVTALEAMRVSSKPKEKRNLEDACLLANEIVNTVREREKLGWTPFEKTREAEAGYEIFENNRYIVHRRQKDEEFIHLSIRSLENDARHDWREYQRIKNELAGEEWEGVELYPAESRKVDGANQFHVWCVPSRLTIGFSERLVTENPPVSNAINRQFDKEF